MISFRVRAREESQRRLFAYSCVSLPLAGGTWRNHSETCAGCIVSLTAPTRSSLKASKSVSSLSLAEKASRVFLASYLRRKKRRSMKDWKRRRKGLNRAAIKRVEATTARVDFSPVRATTTLCSTTMPPK